MVTRQRKGFFAQAQYLSASYLKLLMALLAICVVAQSADAQAGGKAALVLSADEYSKFAKSATEARLGKEIASALSEHGYDVVLTENPTNSVARANLRDFALKASGADHALIILIGHGASVGDLTYFFPVNIEITKETDLFSRGLSIPGVAQIAGKAKSGAVLFLMSAPTFTENLPSISLRPTLVNPTNANVAVAFSTSDKVPASRINSVTAQAALEVSQVVKESTLRLPKLIAAATAGGMGKRVGEVPDVDLYFTAPINPAPKPQSVEKPETQPSPAISSPTPETPAVGKVDTPSAEAAAKKNADLQSLRLVESMIGPEKRRALQVQLRNLEFYQGPIDGVFGELTREAIMEYQRVLKSEVTGYLTPIQLKNLTNK